MSEESQSGEVLRDFSLASGERQIGENLNLIRLDHLIRYQLACDYLLKNLSIGKANGLDIFCGNGYGTYLTAKFFPEFYVYGIDASAEAINLANKHYSLDNNAYSLKIFPFILPFEAFDFILCFESLEHVERDDSMFLEMYSALRKNGLIFISVPNGEKHSLAKNPHQFHYRHYIHDEFLRNFASNLELIDWYGQDVCEFNEDGTNKYKLLPDKETVPRRGEHGQVNIYIFRKR